MNGKKILTANQIANESMKWIEKIIEILKPFKPDKKRFRINYQTRSAEIKLAITKIDGFSKKWRKIEFPTYQGFELKEIQTASMEFISPDLIQTNNGKSWIINPKKLNTDSLLITFTGGITEKALNSLVRVQPSINRDRTDKFEKYWLSSMIQDIEIWESLWNILEIEDVTNNVEVALASILQGIFPIEIQRLLKTTVEFNKAGMLKDRNKLYNAWRQYRIALSNAKLTPDKVMEIIKKVSEAEYMRKFLDVDLPYRLGNIQKHSDIVNLMPKFIQVDAVTNLSLKKPSSTGYLTFKKHDFGETIVNQLNGN